MAAQRIRAPLSHPDQSVPQGERPRPPKGPRRAPGVLGCSRSRPGASCAGRSCPRPGVAPGQTSAESPDAAPGARVVHVSAAPPPCACVGQPSPTSAATTAASARNCAPLTSSRSRRQSEANRCVCSARARSSACSRSSSDTPAEPAADLRGLCHVHDLSQMSLEFTQRAPAAAAHDRPPSPPPQCRRHATGPRPGGSECPQPRRAMVRTRRGGRRWHPLRSRARPSAGERRVPAIRRPLPSDVDRDRSAP